MRIQKFQTDEDGVIRIPKCVAALWVGMQKDVPTIICFVAESQEMGKDLQFYVKQVGEQVSIDEIHQIATTLVTADAEYVLFGEKPKIITPGNFPPMPPGMGGGAPPMPPQPPRRPSFSR